jgi:hypothetical protein
MSDFRQIIKRIMFLLILILPIQVQLSSSVFACLTNEHAQLSYYCRTESVYSQVLSTIFDELVEPKQIAVLAGVSKYPNLPNSMQLPPAAYDLKMLRSMFLDTLHFDEIIVLENDEFSLENINYLFQVYLPNQLSKHPRSRVVFAFSGHGADYEDSGYLFTSDTKTLKIDSYEDTSDAIDLDVLKAALKKSITTSQHFLVLLNACHGGHFLDVSADFGTTVFEEKGAHAITAGGANEIVHAYENVGSGKGSVFFEVLNAAFQNKEVFIAGQKFVSPSADDGLITTSELATFLTGTIQIIENYRVTPRFGRLRPAAPGRQGEFFFVVDEEKAKSALNKRFPTRVARYFGGRPEQDVAEVNPLEKGWEVPKNWQKANPDLIRSEYIVEGDYEIINDSPWARKVLIKGTSNIEMFQPRAKVIDGRLTIMYLEKNDLILTLKEYNPATRKSFIVDQAQYVDGSGYLFDDSNNLRIIGDYIYYYFSRTDKGRKYKIGSQQPPVDEDFVGARFEWLRAVVSPNKRYIVTGRLGPFDPSALENISEEFRLALINEDEAFTGIAIYDQISKKKSELFKQKYSGDWSIGEIVWSDDSTRIYFDNSGPQACIWEYLLAERKLRKIVPEHDALWPFFFRYQNQEYILYVNTKTHSILVATDSSASRQSATRS